MREKCSGHSLPGRVTMIMRSPPRIKGPCPCRPGALTRRCERPGASIISSPQSIFTVTCRDEGEAFKPMGGSGTHPGFFRNQARFRRRHPQANSSYFKPMNPAAPVCRGPKAFRLRLPLAPSPPRLSGGKGRGEEALKKMASVARRRLFLRFFGSTAKNPATLWLYPWETSISLSLSPCTLNVECSLKFDYWSLIILWLVAPEPPSEGGSLDVDAWSFPLPIPFHPWLISPLSRISHLSRFKIPVLFVPFCAFLRPSVFSPKSVVTSPVFP